MNFKVGQTVSVPEGLCVISKIVGNLIFGPWLSLTEDDLDWGDYTKNLPTINTDETRNIRLAVNTELHHFIKRIFELLD